MRGNPDVMPLETVLGGVLENRDVIPLNSAPSCDGVYRPPSNTQFLGPTRTHVANDISIGSAVLQGSRSLQTDRPTDHVTPSVAIGRV